MSENERIALRSVLPKVFLEFCWRLGLNMAYSEKIFQMFQRLHSKREFPGTGIGLAVAKKIVERHGGRIWVESEEGKGAIFFFSIPRSMGKQANYDPQSSLTIPINHIDNN